MEREIDLNEISDGKKYDIGDMVKAGTDDCSGCHACCCGMGESIVLNPYDVYVMTGGLGKKFEDMLNHELKLTVVDAIILPCLTMQGAEDGCSFLSAAGRCSIHPYRPGICRLFPLGRVFEDGDFKYFLQTGECAKSSHSKVKIKNWIDTPDDKKNSQFINTWHYFLKDIYHRAPELGQDNLKEIDMMILDLFYMKPYDTDNDFYVQFERRLKFMKTKMNAFI